MASAAAATRAPPNTAPPKQQHQVPRDQSGDKVTVACRLPNGIVMQLFKKGSMLVPVLGHGDAMRRVEMMVPDPERPPITAVGWRGPDGKRAHGTVAGYGLTPNVPLGFWESWLEQNEKQPYVVNKLVFVHSTDTAGMARAHKGTDSGLEPLNMRREDKIVNGRVVSVPVDVRVAREAPRVETKTEDD